ncbi:hypothetical protein BGZ67_003240 [Mortierella alpina]|nr:hypothetical protein BGZ67_003240 [Mortierella alpina]
MPRQRVRVTKEALKLRPLFPMVEGRIEVASHRQMHLEHTGALLRKMLLRRDYHRAYKLYNIMLSCRTDISSVVEKKTVSYAEEFAWKIGSELLRQKEEYEPQYLKFLQLILVKSRGCREQILLEVMLYHLRCGQMEGACDAFEPFIELAPCNENPVLLGYAGIVHFALWRKVVRDWRKQSGQDLETGDLQDEWHDNDEGSQEVTSLSQNVTRHATTAIRLLEDALERDPTQDMFLMYLVRLKCGRVPATGFGPQVQLSWKRKGAIQSMTRYLKKFYSRNNSSLLALQLLAALENRQKPKTLELILQQDPASDSELYVKAYLDLIERALPQSQRDFLKPTAFSHLATIERMDLPVQAIQRQLCNGNWRYRLMDFRPELAVYCIPIPFRDHGNETQLSEQCQRSRQAHQPDVKYFRPILRCLLTRAEFGMMTPDEERQLISICKLFCFCSLYCRRVSKCDEVPTVPRIGSCFDDLPDDKRPAWYNRLAAILSRNDEP